MISVLLADDQNLIIEGIQAILSSEPDLEIVGTADGGKAAVKKAEILKPNVLVMDVEMPDLDGIAATKLISKKTPTTKIIILSSFEKTEYVIKAFKAGACGYMLKRSMAKDLKNAIRTIDSGYTQIETLLLFKILSRLKIKDIEKNWQFRQYSNTKYDDFVRRNNSNLNNINNLDRMLNSNPRLHKQKYARSQGINRNTLSPIFDLTEIDELEESPKEDNWQNKSANNNQIFKIIRFFLEQKLHIKFIIIFLLALLLIFLIAKIF